MTNICRCGTYARIRTADPRRGEVHEPGKA